MFSGFFHLIPSQKTPSILKPKGTHSGIPEKIKPESPNSTGTLICIEVQSLNLRPEKGLKT